MSNEDKLLIEASKDFAIRLLTKENKKVGRGRLSKYD